jgi:adenine-specific DNA-methyltransferase
MTDQPEHLDLTSHNLPADKSAELLHLFPEIRTEGGQIDFDKLRLALGQTVDVGRERYGMNWPGKAECFKTIQTPSMGTLLPAPSESVDFDTTENLIIEGDNLEALKLLQKAYLGKVKMIYIDPPYNTGNDFIYPDNYTESLQTYLEYTGQVDDEGKKFGTNSDTDGRFHSRWINMMYPRLYLARNLLRDDGVVFISIGEKELTNLEKICNEIFGEDNQISIVSRVSKSASDKGTFFAPSVDFILCYSKTKEALAPFVDEVDESLYQKTETEGPRKGEKYRDDIALYQSSLDITRGSYNQRYWIKCPDGSFVIPPGKTFPPERGVAGDGVWRWTPETCKKNEHLLVFKNTKTSPLLDKSGNKAIWNIYTKSYLKDRQEKGTRPRNFLDEYFNRKGADLLKKYGIVFEYSKPIELIGFLLDITTPIQGDIILDFFAGSASTAHAVTEKNKKDNSQLKYILVQLPEPLDEEARQLNKGLETVADICKERMRRVVKKMNDEEAGQFTLNDKQDRGFRVFKLAESNFKAWDASAPKDKSALEKQLEMHIEHIRGGRTSEDILYEILLKSGFPLTTPVEKIEAAGKSAYSVAGGGMLICLEKELTLEAVRAMTEMKPQRVVCLDLGFAGNDQLKTNAVQIFKNKEIVFKTV